MTRKILVPLATLAAAGALVVGSGATFTSEGNASHQLRTPLTALSLELEDLAMSPQLQPDVAAQLDRCLSEVDRLSEAVNQLLNLARRQRLGTAVDLDVTNLLAEAVQRWQGRAHAQDRRLVQVKGAPSVAHVLPGPVAQILDVLIHNALKHGTGDVHLAANHLGSHVQISVSDEGRRRFSADVFERGVRRTDSSGHGVGLTIASELAGSLGGMLSLADTTRTRFVLTLPTRAQHPHPHNDQRETAPPIKA